jgi:DNA-binding MurR/RpiR family transcriptional regulator
LRAAAAESGDLLDALSPEQVERFLARLAKENRDFAKDQRLAESPADRRAKRVTRNIERLEDWFGALTDAQIERVRQYSVRAPLDDVLRDQDRKRMQRELVGMIKAKQAHNKLVPWAMAWDQNRDPAYEELRKENLKEYFAMLLDLDKSLSTEQRNRAVQRLRGFAGDFAALVAAAEGVR